MILYQSHLSPNAIIVGTGGIDFIWAFINAGAVTPILPPVNVTLPIITGTTTDGETLAGSNGTWTNNPTAFTYQWYRDGVLIAGATQATYTLTLADVGHALTIAVTASNSAGSATATSLPTAIVQASTSGTGEWHSWRMREIAEEEDMMAIVGALVALDVL